MQYNWDWSIFWQQSADGTGTYLDMLVRGFVVTLYTAFLAWILALGFGSLIGVLRTLPGRVPSVISAAWIGYFRNIPLLVHLFLLYFVLPEVLPFGWGTWLKQLPASVLVTAVVGIGLFMSARVAVQVEAGIRSLPPGQRAAGTALGLTTWQTYRYVLLPVAYRIMLPALTSDMINTIKNTSVALTIGLVELTAAARAMQEMSYQIFEAFTVATIVYVTLNLVATAFAAALERRLLLPGQR
ncbi:amino acid ABC transporter permease [uncultured Enterovirga sp.]|uniref:amino acid ABC transporter permease n=1 Tax=uncultured Enterovirga sp. TaxID=2026352 RepID=UPI0035C9DC80